MGWFGLTANASEMRDTIGPKMSGNLSELQKQLVVALVESGARMEDVIREIDRAMQATSSVDSVDSSRQQLQQTTAGLPAPDMCSVSSPETAKMNNGTDYSSRKPSGNSQIHIKTQENGKSQEDLEGADNMSNSDYGDEESGSPESSELNHDSSQPLTLRDHLLR